MDNQEVDDTSVRHIFNSRNGMGSQYEAFNRVAKSQAKLIVSKISALHDKGPAFGARRPNTFLQANGNIEERILKSNNKVLSKGSSRPPDIPEEGSSVNDVQHIQINFTDDNIQ